MIMVKQHVSYVFHSSDMKQYEKANMGKPQKIRSEAIEPINEFTREYCTYEYENPSVHPIVPLIWVYERYEKLCKDKGIEPVKKYVFSRFFKLLVVRDEFIPNIGYSVRSDIYIDGKRYYNNTLLHNLKFKK